MSARADKLKEHVKNPAVAGFLDIIAESEGVKHGYHTMFGNTALDSIEDHPRTTVPFTNTKGDIQRSSAAGRYQFLESTWDHEAKSLGLSNFSAANQDLVAVSLLERSGALQDILDGKYESASEKASKTWMSLPGGGEKYAQRSHSKAWLDKRIEELTKKIKQDSGDLSEDPLYGKNVVSEDLPALNGTELFSDQISGSSSNDTDYFSLENKGNVVRPTSELGKQLGLNTLQALGVYGDSPNRAEALEDLFGGVNDMRTITDQIANYVTEEYTADMMQGAADVLADGTESEQTAAVEYVNDGLALVQELHERGIGIDFATAVSLTNGEASPKEVGYQAVKLKMMSDVADFSDSRSATRMVWDFVTHFSDFAYLASVLQIDGVSSALSVDELLDKATIALHSIEDPIEQLETWETVKEAVIDAHYNKATALDVLSKLASPEDIGKGSGYGLGWVSLASIGPFAVAAGVSKMALRGGREVAVLSRVRKYREAARSAREAMTDEQVAELTRTTRTQAATDVAPVASPISGAPLNEVGPEYQRDVQEFQGRIKTIVNRLLGKETILEVDTFTPEDLVRAQANLEKQVVNTIENTHIIPENIRVTPVEGAYGKVVLEFEGVPLNTLKGSEPATEAEMNLVRMQVAIKEEHGLLPEGSLNRLEKALTNLQPSKASLDDAFDGLQDASSIDFALGQLDQTTKKKFKITLAASFDDTVGALEQTSLPLGASVMSPMGAARTADVRKQVQEALLLDNLSAKVAHEFHSEAQTIFKGFSRSKRTAAEAKVRSALLDGDEWQDAGVEVGKVFSPNELRTYYKMTDDEIAAYQKMRELADAVLPISNKSMRDEMVRKGYRDVKLKSPIRYVDADGATQEFQLHDVGIPMKSYKEADTTLGKSGARRIYNPQTGQMEGVSTQNLKQIYQNGRQIVRLSEATKIPGVSGRVRHIIVDSATEVRDLPMNVHKTKEGWVPRSYTGGQYFVKEVLTGGTVDGAPISADDLRVRGKTHGLSSNRKAADALAEQLSKSEGKEFKAFSSDQMDPTELMLSENRSRLYTSGRGERPVPQYEFNRNGELVEAKAARQDPFQAIGAAINNVAFNYPRNEWRMSELARLEKSAKDLDIQWNGINQEATGGTPDANAFINRKRMEMRDWLAMPDTFTEKWDYAIQRVYEAALGTEIMGKRLVTSEGMVGRGLWWLKSHDPITAARASAFHLMLGMFNPSQLWVQGQGSAVAFSQLSVALNGVTNVSKAISLQRAMHLLENQTPETALKNLRRMVDKGMFDDMSYEAAESFLDGWNRSGLREGVMTNADFRAAESGFGNMWYGATNFMEGPGMMFYRAGETFSRRLSYVAAHILHMEKNPTLKGVKLNDSQLGEIVARSNDFMLNLGKSNRASWQKGLPSLTTQFWQVWAKQTEQYLNFSAGKVLTKEEKLKLLIGQIGLYGSHGIPLFGGAVAYNIARDSKFEGGNDPVHRMVEEGLWGLTFALLGADITAGTRGAVLSDMEGLINDWAFGAEDMSTLLRGAFGSLGIRSGEAMRKLQSLAVTSMMGDSITNPNDLMMFVDALAGLSSTWSNATKGLVMMNADKLQTRSGMIIKNKDFNLATEIGVMLGFQALDEQRFWSLKGVNGMRDEARVDIRNSIKQVMQDRFRVANMTGKWSEDDARKLDVIIAGLGSILNDREKQEVAEDLRKELAEGSSAWAREVKKFRDDNLMIFSDEILSFWEQMNAGAVSTEY